MCGGFFCMRKLLSVAAAIAVLAAPAAALAQTTGTYGDVQVVNTGPASNPEVFELTSNLTGAGYAGLYFEYTTPILLSDITQLSADYDMTVGTFGGGAPRFTIFDASFNAAYVYFGTPAGGGTFTDPLAGAYGNTGNYADLGSGDLRVQSNGFGGFNSGFPPISFADLVANAGATAISYVTLDLDAGTFTNLPDGQQMLADNFTVNNSVFAAGAAAVPEPATWAVMILGFGFAGAALRRRRTVAFAHAA